MCLVCLFLAPLINKRSENPVHAIQSSNPVSFCHGRVIEGRIQEVSEAVNLIRLLHDSLTNMDNLGRLVAETMDTKNLQCLPMKQNLQHTGSFTCDLGTCQAREEGFTNFIGDRLFGQPLLPSCLMS